MRNITKKSGVAETLIIILLATTCLAVFAGGAFMSVKNKPAYPYSGPIKDGASNAVPPHWKSMGDATLARSTREWHGVLPLSQWNGVIPSPKNVRARIPSLPKVKSSTDIEQSTWTQWVVPPRLQQGGSCVGNAWANWMELMIRRYVGRDAIPIGKRIDGEKIYQTGRDLYYKGKTGEGLMLMEGFYAMQYLGIIPKDAKLVSVKGGAADIGQALLKTPLVQGNLVDAGWDNPSLENGCLDHRPKKFNGGHATVRIGLIVQNGTVFYLSQNSWGEWGWHGLFIMNEGKDLDGQLEEPYTVEMPIGWESWDGWKKYLTK